MHELPPFSWQVTVGEGSHPNKVKVYGPGVEKTGLKANEPTYFTVDCSEAGQGKGAFRCGRNTVASRVQLLQKRTSLGLVFFCLKHGIP